MPRVKDLSIDDLEYLIEQKILAILGNPDSGPELSDEFKQKLRVRREKPSKRIPHEEVLDRFGQD